MASTLLMICSCATALRSPSKRVDDEASRPTLSAEAVGSRWYLALELEDGFAQDISPRADVYSLGKILYWILAGRAFSREKHRDTEFDLTTKQTKPKLFIVCEVLDAALTKRSFKDGSELTAAVETAMRRIETEANAAHVWS